MVNSVEWNQFNTGSNLVPIATFAKYGCIDHLWVIIFYQSTKKSVEVLKKMSYNSGAIGGWLPDGEVPHPRLCHREESV